MTPQEKAIELVDKFMIRIIFNTKQNIEASVIETAKKCALLAVVEILMALPSKPKEIETLSGNINILIPDFAYWTKVQSEIEKL